MSFDSSVSSNSSSSTKPSNVDISSGIGPAKLPAIPDMRLEQFFLSTIRQHVFIDGVSPESYVSATHTPWEKVYAIQWRPMLWLLLWEQLISPLWQGVLWGLGGVFFVCMRQSFVYARSARVPPPPRPRGIVPFVSQMLARLGLGGLAI